LQVNRKFIHVVTAVLLDAGLLLAQSPGQAPIVPRPGSGNGALLLQPVAMPDSGTPWPIANVGSKSAAGGAAQDFPVPPPPGTIVGNGPVTTSVTHYWDAGREAASQEVFRFSADYLLWQVRGGVPNEIRSILYSGPSNGDGLLSSLPMTAWQSGFRASARFAPNADAGLSYEVAGFYMSPSHGQFDASLNSHPGVNPSQVPAVLLLHPVINGVIDVANSRGVVDSPIPGPGGAVDLDPSDTLATHMHGSSERQLWGLEANVHSAPIYFGGVRLDGLAGFRNVNLKERITVQGDFSAIEPGPGGDPDELPGNPENGHTSTLHTFDSIEARNNFYGGQVGFTFETMIAQGFTFGGYAKFALGSNVEKVTLVGSTVLDATTVEPFAGGPFIPRPAAVLPGGLFTPQVPGGIHSNTSHISYIPDLNLNFGYQFNRYLQAYVGYNYMLMSNVARIGSLSPIIGASGQGHLEVYGWDFGIVVRY
jgi:hypothetical protein